MNDQFQANVSGTIANVFGPESANSDVHRASRFIEEALELVQAQGMSRERAKRILYYVYDRPVGEPKQEVGGVCVTLAGLCQAMGIDMMDAAHVEHMRLIKNGTAIAAKNLSKPKSLDIEPIRLKASGSTPEEAAAAFDPNRAAERRTINGNHDSTLRT